MEYMNPSEQDFIHFTEIVGSEYIITHQPELENYASDYTENLQFMPAVVLIPATPNEISRILSYCNEKMIAVTTRGAGTGLSGGALPVKGGVVIAMQRFNRIIEIDERNLQVTVEPGVINQVLQDAVSEKGLMYPPDPASKGSCFLGGNIAHSSGGPKAVKYGTTKDYVLNLEMVMANGTITWTGANVLKNSTGYNFTQLMIGSEGTLGIITKIVFRLIPKPKHQFLMLAQYKNATEACAQVSKIFQQGFIPSGCEFMTRNAIKVATNFLKINNPFADHFDAFLLIELDGNNAPVLQEEGFQLAELLTEWGCDDVLIYDSAEQKEYIWKIRRSIGEAAKHDNIYKEEDTVVPRADLPALLNELQGIEQRYHFRTVVYGHAGDGNLHINILKDQLEDEYWDNEIPKAIREIFEVCHRLKGTISGEHGIGYVQKRYMDIVLNETMMALSKKIKSAFDPNGILNPGKIFPDH